MQEVKWFDYKFKKSKTDIFLSNRDWLNLSTNNQNLELDLAWFNYLSKHAPRGNLLLKNSYKEDLLQRKILLLHVTPSYEDIKKSGKILSSGGGLGSAIYCCLVHKNKKIHNLSLSYLRNTMPKRDKKFKAFLIELTLNKNQRDKMKFGGVDYTLFGETNCKAWKAIKRDNSTEKNYVDKLESEIANDLMNILPQINRLIEYDLEELSFDEFNTCCKKIFYTIPPLRFILYEIFTEYILLYQNNRESLKWEKRGELYNGSYKKFIWALCPNMLKKFNMTNFYIDFEKAIKYLKKSNVISSFDPEHFKNFIKWRTAFYLRKLSGSKIKAGKFEQLVKNHPYLIGQILYRKFRDKNHFEKERIKIMSRQRERDGLILPIYSLLPKGEVGINPNLSKMGIKYRIFDTTINKKNEILVKKELNLKLENCLIEKHRCSYRD